MIKIIFLAIFLIFLSNPLWAQETQPLPRKLPAIIVRGEDKSYLEIIRTKGPAQMSYRGQKELIRPPLETFLAKKPYYPPSYPTIERAPLVKVIPRERRGISPPPLPRPSLSTLFGSYDELIWPLEYPRGEEFIGMSYRGQKELIRPPLEIPPREKTVPAPKREKLSLPYLGFSAYLGKDNNFGYLLNYGKKEKEEKNICFFTLERDFTSHYVKYENKFLPKEGDRARLELSWDLSEEKKFSLGLEGSQGKMDFPEEEGSKNKLGIKGDWRFRGGENTFKVKGWAEKSGIDDPHQEWEGLGYGAQVEMGMRELPLSLGIDADWEVLNNGSTRHKNQSHFWIRSKAIPVGNIKGLAVSARIGTKGIGNRQEFLPYLNILYQVNPRMRIKITGEKEFYLSKFSDLYISNDYVEVNPEVGPSNTWNYKLGLEYKASSRMDISFEAFHREGEEVIWNGDGAKLQVRPINADILLQGGRLRLLHRFSDNFEQEFVYTHQEAKNTVSPGKVVPYLPQILGEFSLKWSQNDWDVEAKGEIIGERYYEEENTSEKLPSGWKGSFKVSKKIGKEIKGFIQLELNDYELWKNYYLPDNKLIIGIEAQLY